MTDRTELQILLGRDLDQRDKGRKFKRRDGGAFTVSLIDPNDCGATSVEGHPGGYEYIFVGKRGNAHYEGQHPLDLIGFADDEPLRVGDWAYRRANSEWPEQVFRIGVITDGGKWLICEDTKRCWMPEMCRHATAAEILAASASAPLQRDETGGAAKEEIEVGDTVELLRWPEWIGGSFVGRKVLVTALIRADGWTFADGHSEMQEGVNHDQGGRWPLKFCRLISKGKKGQGERSRKAQGTGAADCSIQSPELGACTAKPSPCPACSGSGVQPGFGDETIACGKCQYGKPRTEPPVAKPYHKMIGGECVVIGLQHICHTAPFTPTDERGDRARTMDKEIRKIAAANLAAAKAECKRLGLEE